MITLANGTLMARRTTAARQVIPSVGHSASYYGFSGDGKDLPAGSIEVSSCRPRRFRGKACLPGRGDDPLLLALLSGAAGVRMVSVLRGEGGHGSSHGYRLRGNASK